MSLIKNINIIFSVKEKKKIILLLLLNLTSAIIEIFSITLVFPLLAFILNPFFFEKFTFFQKFKNSFLLNIIHEYQFFFIILIMIIFILKYFYSFFIVKFQARILATLEKDLKLKVFKSYINKPYIFFLNNKASQLIVNINISIQEFIFFFLNSIIGIITEAIIFIGLILVFFYVTSFVFLINKIYFLSVPIFIFFVYIYLRVVFKKNKLAGAIATQEVMATQKYIQQGFQSIREIKLFHSHRYFVNKLHITLESLQKQNLFLYSAPYYPRLFLEFIFIILIFILISVLIYLNFSSIKILTILGGFAAISFRIFPSFNRMINAIQMIRNHRHLLDIISNALESKELEENILDVQSPKNFEKNICTTSENFISIKKLTFKYNVNSKNVFKNFNFQIYKNEFICIVGKSGCGKSTLIDIISGLIKPDEGEVLVDGQDIYKNKKLINLWQERISFVPQNVFLFNDTISQNIALLDIENNQINKDRIKQLIEDFELSDFIKSLDFGLDTVINENVLNISGGQRQRIAIVRAFYKNSDIIIMDEPTNSLDKITEKKIILKILENRSNKTIILVTHNEDIIKYADRVIRV